MFLFPARDLVRYRQVGLPRIIQAGPELSHTEASVSPLSEACVLTEGHNLREEGGAMARGWKEPSVRSFCKSGIGRMIDCAEEIIQD